MPECPYSGKWFRSKKGLKVHISWAHTTTIADRRILDPSTIDPLGTIRRREKRRARRRKKQSFFDSFL